MTDDTLQQQVRRLLDESEIRAVLARYVRGSDRMDMDLLRSCYHDDATDAHGRYNGDIDGFIAWSLGYNERIEAKAHLLGQSTIDLDGDTAWVETYCWCLLRIRDDAGERNNVLGNIRYVDLFERRHSEWRIRHRKVIHHPGLLVPVDNDPPFAELAMLGRMDADDPSYDRRPGSFLP